MMLDRENMGAMHRCNLLKREELVSSSFLESNEVETIGSRCSPRLLKSKMEKEPNFVPHLRAIEKNVRGKIETLGLM